MSSFPVSPDKLAQLQQRMSALGVNEAEIEETFVRSGGAGGQKVNKSSSCVMLLHRPTGLRVKSQTTRHQARNRFMAWCRVVWHFTRNPVGRCSSMTQEELLFTFCPPAPPERTNISSRSLSRTSNAFIRCSSCASLSGEGGNEVMPPA